MTTVTIMGRTERVQMTIPESWNAEDIRDEIELLAIYQGREGVFAPNLVVTVNPYEGSMAEFMQAAVGNVVSTLQDARIIDISTWNRTQEFPLELAAQGRAITYTHVSPASGEVLRTTDWLFTEGGLAVQATGTSAAPDWMVFAPELEAIASSLITSESEADLGPVAPELPDGAQDELASAELGQPVESIGELLKHQPYDYSGEWVPARAFALMDEMAEGLKIGRLQAEDYSDELEELARVGFVEGTKLTDLGEVVRLHLAEPTAAFRVSGAGSAGESYYQAWVHGSSVLVAAGAGYHVQTELQPNESPSPDHANIMILPITGLARDIASWVGLAPAWPLAALPSSVPLELIAQRWAGNTEPPADANPVLAELWKQNWFTWTVTGQGEETSPEPYSYLHGGPLGQFRIGADGDRSWLIATHSVYAYDQLDDVIAAAIFDRQVRLH